MRILMFLLVAMLAAHANAAQLAHIEGKVGSVTFSYTAPASMAEMLAQMKGGHTPPIADFGGTSGFDRIGFRQLITVSDGSTIELELLLPVDMAMALKPGVHPLGGATVQAVDNGSNDGWDGQCPDNQEASPVLLISHYSRPEGASNPAMAMIASGTLTRQLQTHITRIHRDAAQLNIQSVDRAGGYVSGEAHGKVSMIAPKDDKAVNDKKPYEWMCRPGEYKVDTEAFEVRFTLELAKRIKSAPAP